MILEQQLRALTYNQPCRDLLERGRRRDYLGICVPLYKASIRGDWDAASVILRGHEDLVRYSITGNKETALHVAAAARSTEFVKNLVEMMAKEDLALKNEEENTAFCLAVRGGNVEMCKIMVEKNKKLMTIRGSENMMPLYLAASHVQYDMVTYLYDNSQQMASDSWTDDDRNKVFLKCIEVDFFDVALKILDDNTETQLSKEKHLCNVLDILARKPRAFDDERTNIIHRIIHSGSRPKESEATHLLRKIWKKIVEKPRDEIDVILRGPMVSRGGNDTYPSQILFVAAELGNTKFLVELIREDPDLIWMKNDDGQSIFHIAVFHRHQSIFNLLYDMGSMRDMVTQVTDKVGNNMLHAVSMNPGKNPHEEVWGPAFQMQHELKWFKEVKDIIAPHFREMKNAAGQTPYQLFTEYHKDLVSEGETWIKGTINQSMVAAALISTIGFSAAFTIPGGYDQNNGFPIFHKNKLFSLFVVLTAMSFILSSSSILVFLFIMIHNYDQDYFYQSLPIKLMLGQASLLYSIITAMAAFCVSFFVQYHNKLPIIITILVAGPVILLFQRQLLYMKNAVKKAYRNKPKRRMLYYQNPRF